MSKSMQGPLSAGQREIEGESIVGVCDAAQCLYNQARHCTAGTINVTFMDRRAQCGTFTPRAGADSLQGQQGIVTEAL